jgi:glycosyltransferase involved in cell wall biosynthesis
MDQHCTLVIPCYNEAERLRLAEFVSFAASRNKLRYIFVDDGSTDATREVLSALVSQLPRQAALLALPRNAGKGEAVRQGVLQSFADQPAFFGYWDADLATPLAAVELLLARLAADPPLDLAMGSRVRRLGSHIVRSPGRHYLGRIMATAISLALDLPSYDTQCGAKLFRNSPRTRRLFESPFLSRWLFDVELIARLLPCGKTRRQSQVVEVPLPHWVAVPGSKVSLAAGAWALCDLWRIARAHRHSGSAKELPASAAAGKLEIETAGDPFLS